MDGDAVWAQTTHGGMLRDLFGHVPTLHDAVVRRMDIDRASDQVTFELDYADQTSDGGPELHVRMQLVWGGVQSLELNHYGNELYNVRFSAIDGLIETRFEGGYGIHGRIVAERFEVILLQVDPPKADPDEIHWLRIEMR